MQHFRVSRWWCGEQRLGFLAMSTFSPIGSWSSNGMRMCVCASLCACVCGWNELEACAMLAYPHVSVHSVHTHPQTIWGQQTDGAKSGYCRIFNMCAQMLMRARGCSDTVCTGRWLWKTEPWPRQGLNFWQHCAWLFGPLINSRNQSLNEHTILN